MGEEVQSQWSEILSGVKFFTHALPRKFFADQNNYMKK
jgi:hypothetical protein